MESALQEIRAIARAVAERGGRALLVGGAVRDRVLGIPLSESKDLDVEVLGLSLEALEQMLSEFGTVRRMGASFPVLQLAGRDVDWSVPSDADKVGLDFADAALRRDLTLNAMALDPLSEELLDPHGGRRDIEARTLRATSRERFGDDPLRALRVAQLAARLDMEPDGELLALCAEQDLSGVAGERIFEEWRKLLLRSAAPSKALDVMRRSRVLRFFPELEALEGVPQDPEWHPEGDVWVHTLMVIDRAAELRSGDAERDLVMMFAALCHDLGKPATTVFDRGRHRSPAHDDAGVPITEAMLERMRASGALREQVCALVAHHLAPALFTRDGEEAGPRGYRRLARRLAAAGSDLRMLERVARADHLGRTTDEALSRRFPAGDRFLARAAELEVEAAPLPDVVRGRDLIARGHVPGPELGRILDACRAYQDESGEKDVEAILEVVLGR